MKACYRCFQNLANFEILTVVLAEIQAKADTTKRVVSYTVLYASYSEDYCKNESITCLLT
jgi:hypothetical protein